MGTDKQIEKDLDYAFGRDNKCPVCEFRFIWKYFNNNKIEAENGRDVFDCPGCGILLVSFKLSNGKIQVWRENEVM